jgi:hypothetical protein
MTPNERVQRIFDNAVGSDLSSWEKFEFLPSIKNMMQLTVKQNTILCQVERKVLDNPMLLNEKGNRSIFDDVNE